MARPSDDQQEALAGLLGLGSQSQRKSHYAELQVRLEELEAERNRYKWLFENAVHGIFQAHLERGMLAANPALVRMLGYAEPQLLGSVDLARQLFVGGTEELLMIRSALQEKGGLYGYETQLRQRNGRRIAVVMNLLLKPDEDGVFEGFVADISERKRAQQHLQLLNDQLEERVALRTAELRVARDAAEEANRSKDRFLAAASHDLLQPLNAARLLIATLRERALPSAERQLVERTHQALDGAEELLADLLDISVLDQGAQQADLAVHELDELVKPLACEFQSVAEAAGLQLRLHLPRLAVRTDLRLAGRLLRNLLSNACRYTARGGILLAARRRGERVRIEVWDTGRGIPQDQLQAIFEEFRQVESGRGAGLGLAIVDRVSRILATPVSVSSRLGRGSCFAFELPLASLPTRMIVEQPVLSLGDPLPGRRLLVVDNEQSILDSMAALLGQWGCEVLLARDLQAAEAVLQGRAPDALLVDYHLDHDQLGSAVVSQLRACFAANLPAVMITADRSELCVQQAQEAGVRLLNKPVKPGKLRAVLSQLLS